MTVIEGLYSINNADENGPMPIPLTSDKPLPVFVIGSLVMACSARVARCPAPGESLEASGFIMEAGGKGFNVALAAHRLGVPVDGVFAVGDDLLGSFMHKTFADLGLDVGLIVTLDAPTGAGVGLIQEDGENRIAVYPGANARLSAEHVRAKADQLRVAGLVYAQFEAPDAPIATAFSLAREAGVQTMLNPSPYRSISPEILAKTDILVVNRLEADALALDCLWSGPDQGLAESLASAGVTTLIVTQGAQGASAWQSGRAVEVTGFIVAVIDSIGAGDAFTGAVIAGLIGEEPIEAAVRWGCAAGALKVTRLGLSRALPDSADLRAMLSRSR